MTNSTSNDSNITSGTRNAFAAGAAGATVAAIAAVLFFYFQGYNPYPACISLDYAANTDPKWSTYYCADPDAQRAVNLCQDKSVPKVIIETPDC